MTTPQNQLYSLASQIERLTDLFEPEQQGDEDEGRDSISIFDRIKIMHSQVNSIVRSQLNIENQMALIIKLLSKE